MAVQKKKTITLEDLARMVKHGFDDVDKRFNAVDQRFDTLEKKVDHLEARFDKLEIKVAKLDVRFYMLEKKVDTIEDVVVRSHQLFAGLTQCLKRETGVAVIS